MKKISVLMAFVFILSFVLVQPAQAQEPVYGYIPLLSEGYDASLLRETLSRQQFERLLPDLLEAKAAGKIADFAPDFYGGFVRVTNPVAALRGGSSFLNIKVTRMEAIVKPPAEAVRNAGRTAGFFADMGLYSTCFNISNVGNGSHIKGTLKTASGELLGFTDGFADADGDYWNCWEGYDVQTVPGLKVQFKVFDTSEVLIGSYLITVPRITFKSASKTSGIITGTAVSGKDYQVYWYHPNLDAAGGYKSDYRYGTTSSTGAWSANFNVAMRGQDFIWTGVWPNANFVFGSSFEIPYLGCDLNRPYCFLAGLPNQPVEMSIVHSGTRYDYSGKTDMTGHFYVTLINSSGDPLQLSIGDKISGTGATSFTIPKLTMILNRSTDKITGIAPPSKYFDVGFLDFNSRYSYITWVGSNASGSYSADFTWTDIPTNGYVLTRIYFTMPSTGNHTYFHKINP